MVEGEVGGELVVAGGDAEEVVEAAEGVLDQVTAAIAVFVVVDRAFPVAAFRYDGSRLSANRLPRLYNLNVWQLVGFAGPALNGASGALS